MNSEVTEVSLEFWSVFCMNSLDPVSHKTLWHIYVTIIFLKYDINFVIMLHTDFQWFSITYNMKVKYLTWNPGYLMILSQQNCLTSFPTIACCISDRRSSIPGCDLILFVCFLPLLLSFSASESPLSPCFPSQCSCPHPPGYFPLEPFHHCLTRNDPLGSSIRFFVFLLRLLHCSDVSLSKTNL